MRTKYYLVLLLVFSVLSLAACMKSSLSTQGDALPTTFSTGTAVIPKSSVDETPIPISSNPCENMGKKYLHDSLVGDIKEDYIGSWHAAPMVGSGYNERFVFFPSGNYLFFPSQYDCDQDGQNCDPSPVEEGTWGVSDKQMNLARGGDMTKVRRIPITKVIASPPDESPYPLQTTLDGKTYWQVSTETNWWNPGTGELCD